MCIPRPQAAKNADSLRALPIVRNMLAASRSESRALGEQLSNSEARAWQVSEALVKQTNESEQWKGKARRRGWVVTGLLAALGSIVIISATQ